MVSLIYFSPAVLPSANSTLSRSRQRLIKVDFSKFQVRLSIGKYFHEFWINFWFCNITRTMSSSMMSQALAAPTPQRPPSTTSIRTWPRCIATRSPRCPRIRLVATWWPARRIAIARRRRRWCGPDAQVSIRFYLAIGQCIYIYISKTHMGTLVAPDLKSTKYKRFLWNLRFWLKIELIYLRRCSIWEEDYNSLLKMI